MILLNFNIIFVYKIFSKPVCKGIRIQSIEDIIKEYKKLLEEGWRKTNIFKCYF